MNWILTALYGTRAAIEFGQEAWDNLQSQQAARRSQNLTQADFDQFAYEAARDKAQGKEKRRSPAELLQRGRSLSTEEIRFFDEHLAQMMLAAGAVNLPEMSWQAVWAWASRVHGDPLIQFVEASTLIEREIAAYKKFSWTASDEPFEVAGNLCYLMHVAGMDVRAATYEELKWAEAGERWVAPVESVREAYDAMHSVIRTWYASLGYPPGTPSRYCTRCGNAFAIENRFCTACGAARN